MAVAAGNYHSLALKSDTTVVAWGRNWEGQATVPEGLSNVVAVAAGYWHSLALGTFPPVITVQPFSRAVQEGDDATLTSKAFGVQPLSYQWQFDGTNITGATNSSLTLTNVQAAHAGAYVMVVNNPLGSVTSEPAILTTIPTPPLILQQPQAETVVAAGSPVTWTVVVGREEPFSYQWQFNGTNIAGATSSSLTLTNVQAAHGGAYSVFVNNAAGSVASAAAMLTVVPAAPVIIQQPQTVAIAGRTAIFAVAAVGTEPFSYQWRFNGMTLYDGGRFSGATSATLQIANVQQSDAGSYAVVVGNLAGSANCQVQVVVLTIADDLLVTNTDDSGPGSLRQAILNANGIDGGAISFWNVTGTITLLSALPCLTNITMTGPGTNLLTISGNNRYRVFCMDSGTTNALSGLTIADGSMTNYLPGAIEGAGVANSGKLTLLDCIIRTCTNRADGGGIYNVGNLSMKRCEVVNCNALRPEDINFPGEFYSACGGGIYNGGDLSMEHCRVTNCATKVRFSFLGSPGGGIYNRGKLSMKHSEVANCTTIDLGDFGGPSGGGIYNTTELRMENSTVSGCWGSGGGGIFNGGNLLLTNCLIQSCRAYCQQDGGGIYNGGSLTAHSCTISNCYSSYAGGAIGMRGGSATLTNCTLVANQTGNWGGAIGAEIIDPRISLSVLMYGCTIARNSGGDFGGGIGGYGIYATLINCTVSANRSYRGGGGIHGGVSLDHCTIAFNTAGRGAGGVSGGVRSQNSIFAGNGSNDISGTLTSVGYNLIQHTTGCTIVGDETGNIYGADPLLGPLQDNGGPTWTHALLVGSPATDAGPLNAPPSVDQRGVLRPQGVAEDIGAFELQLGAPDDRVEQLIAQVELRWPRPQALIVTLKAALRSIQRGKSAAALDQLRAFQHQVRAQVTRRDPTLANAFVNTAQEIIESLGGGGSRPGKVHGQFTSVEHQSSGRIKLQFSVQPGLVYLLEASTNLVNWDRVGTAVEQGDGTFTFEDANATRFPNRYYRLVSP